DTLILPAAGDLRAATRAARIDWAVEESLASGLRRPPAVSGVLPVAIRRWRTTLLTRATRREMGRFLRELRAQTYDAVIDTQGLLKSALIARSARGPRYGLDWKSAREPIALFSDRTISVHWALHGRL